MWPEVDTCQIKAEEEETSRHLKAHSLQLHHIEEAIMEIAETLLDKLQKANP